MRAGDAVFLGSEDQFMACRSYLIMNLGIPNPRDVHSRARRLRFTLVSLGHSAEYIIKPLCHNFVLARLHRHGSDQERMSLALSVRHDARLPLEQYSSDLTRTNVEFLWVPGDVEGREGSSAGGSSERCPNAWDLGDLLADIGIPAFPLAEIGLNVALGPPNLHGTQHAHDFFLADFQSAPEGV